MIFNEKLMELRKLKGWSQEDLGNRLNVSRQTVSKWESGQTTPEMNKLIELGSLFEISVDELIGNVQYEVKQNKISSPIRYHYEYKSNKQLFGLPLIHINIGINQGKVCKAKGIVAIGNISKGIISAGLASAGVLSFGILSAGLIALGSVSAGLMAIGGLAAGGFSIGGLSLGLISIGGLSFGVYSIGGCAIGTRIAMGGYANGHIAIGNTASGAYTFFVDKYSRPERKEIEKIIFQEFPNIWKWLAGMFTSF